MGRVAVVVAVVVGVAVVVAVGVAVGIAVAVGVVVGVGVGVAVAVVVVVGMTWGLPYHGNLPPGCTDAEVDRAMDPREDECEPPEVRCMSCDRRITSGWLCTACKEKEGFYDD